MSDENDIICMDASIRSKFQDEYNKIGEYNNDLVKINNILDKTAKLSKRIKENLLKKKDILTGKIKDITIKSSENFYIAETVSIIEEYKKILKTPIKLSFVGKQINSENSEKKADLISKYIEISNKYINNPIYIDISIKNVNIQCENCPNKKLFDIIENCSICTECGTQTEIFSHTTSYKDADRINISAKYTYDRKVHFRDCINQYQGKQNSTIEPKVYEDLTKEFERHHLIENKPGYSKYTKITKDHVLMFLKELHYTKHYENVNLIHYTLTGIRPDDLSHIEDKLLDDFDVLTDLYDKRFKHEKKISRKNFINTQYVLYQLLNRHKHQCKKEDFNILKTIDRKSFHDDICVGLFAELGWNFSHTF